MEGRGGATPASFQRSAAKSMTTMPAPRTTPAQPPAPEPPPAVAGAGTHDARHGALSSAVRATSLMTLGSRVGGLVRDIIVGRVFGATAVGSAFATGFQIPNMFRRLFGEGALSAAFIPEYTDAERTSRDEADRLASLTVYALGLVTGGLTVLIELALLGVLLLAPADHDRALSLKLIMVMLPFMPLICVVAVLAGMLQVHGKFAAAASGPVILNAFMVATGAYFLLTGQLAGPTTAYLFGAATVLSGATQMLWFLRLLRPHVSWTRSWEAARPRAGRMLRKFVPVAVGLGTLQLNTFLDTLIAMWPLWVGGTILGAEYPLDKKSNVILQLTSRLYQFPLGVFGVAVATAAFPLLARHAKEPEAFADTLRRGLRLSLFIGLPATAGLILVRRDAVGVLFGHGRTGWSPEDLARAARVLTGFAVGVWAYSVNQVLTRALYAQGDTRTPMKVSLGMILVNLGLNVGLIWGLRSWEIRESGLAWATASSAVIQTLVLGGVCARMVRRLGAEHALIDGPTLGAAARVVLATAGMAGVVLGALWLMPAEGHGVSPWAWQLGRVLAASAVGGAAYVGLARVLGAQELGWLLHRGK